MANLKLKNEMIKHNGYLLIPVPEDSYDYWLPETNFPQIFFYLHGWTFGDEEFQLSDKVILPDEHYSEKLGEWRKYYQIIGLAKDLKGSDWYQIVDSFIEVLENGHSTHEWFRDYTDPKQIIGRDFSASTAIQSGHSLLKSHSLEPNQTLILKENNL